MDVTARLLEAGFDRVIVLDGPSCGVEESTLLLAIMTYEAELYSDDRGILIHPYYFASQRAYQAASGLCAEAQRQGIGLRLRDEVRVKPIFARLQDFSQGRNTISYLQDAGSRFHVQILELDDRLTPTHSLQPQPHERHCGSCTLCYERCPTHAIDEEGFHRERCLRNWQLGGKPVPEPLRPLMGMRFIGCDECQRCCPHNPPAVKQPAGLPLLPLLTQPKAEAQVLKEQIGANLALPNRVLAQALLSAGCSGDVKLLPAVTGLLRHPSPLVAEHARWALDQLQSKEDDPC